MVPTLSICHGCQSHSCSSMLPYSDARHMARDVQNALLGLIQEEGGMDEQAASDYVKKLHKRNRYLQDVWS